MISTKNYALQLMTTGAIQNMLLMHDSSNYTDLKPVLQVLSIQKKLDANKNEIYFRVRYMYNMFNYNY